MHHTTTPEATFKAYVPSQAAAYAAARGSYNGSLFGKILDHHSSTGGSFSTLLDVGCGPGNSTRPLAKFFENAYGIDPSPEMIRTAVSIGEAAGEGETGSGKMIEYLVGREEMDLPEREGGKGVDLITAGMAVGIPHNSHTSSKRIDLNDERWRLTGSTCHSFGPLLLEH